MLPEHRDIQTWIYNKYKTQFNVLVEIAGQNCLPDKRRHWYQPDVILKSLGDPNDIRYIIEVENDPTRKAIVGACLLADCSLAEMQTATAGLIFVVYSENGKHQINNFREKVKVIKDRCPRLSSICVVTDEDFKRGKGFELAICKKKVATLGEHRAR
jgi:hypothetical protein